LLAPRFSTPNVNNIYIAVSWKPKFDNSGLGRVIA
jgi:hypothetical protein